MIYDTYDEIRAALAEKLGHEPKKRIWDRLVDEAHVQEVWLDIREIDYLEDMYRQFANPPKVMVQPTRNATDLGPQRIRLQILSDLAAKQAGTERAVITFRRQHLTKGLLKREEIVEWIKMQAEEEGNASHYLRVPVPDGYELTTRSGRMMVEPQLSISDSFPTTHAGVELLSYATPDDQWVRRTPVKLGGVLDRLRVVSEYLARRFTWQEAQASTFVLTGLSPVLSGVRGEIRMAFSQPIFSRISMEIDPTLTPEEVAKQYKKLRASLVGARYRSMSEKHLRLAEFYGGDKPEGTTWAALMNEWNNSQDQGWEYDRFESFARDCKQAWHRLMGRDLLKFPEL